MLKVNPQGFLYRSIAFVAGLSLVGIGAVPMLRHGDMLYTNWFGQFVLAPFAVLGGLFIAFCAMFKPDWLAGKSGPKERHRPHWR
jgi:hypothetical protein